MRQLRARLLAPWSSSVVGACLRAVGLPSSPGSSLGRGARRTRRGVQAERRARRHYRLRAYRIVAANVWPGGNELDLIVRRGRRLVFCEVKEKLDGTFGDPAEMVGDEKQRRLRRAARAWLAAHPDAAGLDIRFDVVAVSPTGLARIADAF